MLLDRCVARGIDCYFPLGIESHPLIAINFDEKGYIKMIAIWDNPFEIGLVIENPEDLPPFGWLRQDKSLVPLVNKNN